MHDFPISKHGMKLVHIVYLIIFFGDGQNSNTRPYIFIHCLYQLSQTHEDLSHTFWNTSLIF